MRCLPVFPPLPTIAHLWDRHGRRRCQGCQIWPREAVAGRPPRFHGRPNNENDEQTVTAMTFAWQMWQWTGSTTFWCARRREQGTWGQVTAGTSLHPGPLPSPLVQYWAETPPTSLPLYFLFVAMNFVVGFAEPNVNSYMLEYQITVELAVLYWWTIKQDPELGSAVNNRISIHEKVLFFELRIIFPHPDSSLCSDQSSRLKLGAIMCVPLARHPPRSSDPIPMSVVRNGYRYLALLFLTFGHHPPSKSMVRFEWYPSLPCTWWHLLRMVKSSKHTEAWSSIVCVLDCLAPKQVKQNLEELQYADLNQHLCLSM